jgi:hypothetical protein
MDAYRRSRYDKVREDLRRSREIDEESWERRGDKWVLRMADQNAANRLRRDVPSYLLPAGNVSNQVVYDAGELDAFLGEESVTSRKGGRGILSRMLGRR